MTIKKTVQDLKPGERINVCPREISTDRSIRPPFDYRGGRFTLYDNILESIAGSAYEFGYEINPVTRAVTFFRLEKPLDDGRLSYVSPDRRHFYTFDGRIYHPKETGNSP